MAGWGILDSAYNRSLLKELQTNLFQARGRGCLEFASEAAASEAERDKDKLRDLGHRGPGFDRRGRLVLPWRFGRTGIPHRYELYFI
jgi:hypothetical protein